MPIINSLLDTDLYKLTMQQLVLHQFVQKQVPVNVRYAFLCRDKEIDLSPYWAQIEHEIKEFSRLKFEASELEYLASLPFMQKDYVDVLEHLDLTQAKVIHTSKDGKSGLNVVGSWFNSILYEVPVLAIINQIYFEMTSDEKQTANEGVKRLNEKIDFLLANTDENFKFADFGTRRRYSRRWHSLVVETLKYRAGNRFVGTSNVSLAKSYRLRPIGTFGHEFVMAFQGLSEVLRFPLSDSQKKALSYWLAEYGSNLGIALSDTLTFDVFLKDFDKDLSFIYAGCRQDSGDPFEWCEKLINHYHRLGIEPKTKTAVFSDGLDIPKAIEIYDRFNGEINMVFGIGTNLTNDVGPKPLNIVMKMVECNDHPVAKFSDTPGKTMCENAEYVAQLKQLIGI